MSSFKGLLKRPRYLRGVSKVSFVTAVTPFSGLFFCFKTDGKPQQRSFQIRSNVSVCIRQEFVRKMSTSIRIRMDYSGFAACQCEVFHHIDNRSDTCIRIHRDVSKVIDTSIRVSGRFAIGISTVLCIGHATDFDAETNQIIYNVLLSEDHPILT